MIFPLNIRKLKLADAKNQKANIIDYCPACAYETIIEKDGGAVPAGKDEGEWQCINCGARREWNLEKAREQIWRLYENWFMGIGTFGKTEKANRALGKYATDLAAGLAWIAPVRFVYHNQYRIGHLAINMGIFWLMKQKGLYPPGLDIFAIDDKKHFVSNRYLLDKWLAKFPHSALVRYLPEGTAKLLMTEPVCTSIDYYNVIATADEPPLTFDAEENLLAAEELKKMGVPRDAKIATLVCRDSRYMDNAHPGTDWSYHNYRDVDVNTYRLACEYLADKGYYILRLGADQKEPLIWENERIIDYAFRNRTEFMDVWLSANCDLCISSSTGPDGITYIQNRPILYTNFLPHHFVLSWLPNAIFLFKDLARIDDGAIVPIDEALNPENPLGGYFKAQDYLNAGYRWIDNSPEEILAATKDMLAFMDGSLKLTPDEKNRQEYLWTLVQNARHSAAGYGLHPFELAHRGLFARKYM